MDALEVSDCIIKYLKSNEDYSETEIQDSMSLNALGVDSFSLIEILLFLESEYKILLPARFLSNKNTSSIKQLALTYCDYCQSQEQVNKPS